MPIYGNGRVALDLTATDFELNNLKINGAIVNGVSLVVTVSANTEQFFDTFDDTKYKAAKYTILGKSPVGTQICEVLISVPYDLGGQPIISVYGIVHDGDQTQFDFFDVKATRRIDNNDIELFITSKVSANMEVTALRTYIV